MAVPPEQAGATRSHEVGLPCGTSPISCLFKECLGLASQLISYANTDSLVGTEAFVALDTHANKLRTWGNDTGASTWALDHALRKASRLQQQVLLLLNGLKNELQEGTLWSLLSIFSL